jgi:BirA family biotin operon repressor/biotin-[acetyl-CoA-carboxylase] ligase
VKWPNDVYLDGRKVCGILSESVPGWKDRLVIGVGINVNNRVADPPTHHPPSFSATSLLEHDGLTRDLTEVLIAVLNEFSRRWQQLTEDSFESLARDYRERCLLTGKTLTIQQPGETTVMGLCRGIDDSGRLILRTDEKELAVVSGSVVSWDG